MNPGAAPSTPTAWIVVAHGSRDPSLADAHREVCEAMAQRAGSRATVRAAYLELTEPSVLDAVDAAVAAGATTVVLVPYFLHVGNHTRRDLPALVDQARGRHPGVRLALADHLGFDERLVEVAVDRAVAARAEVGGGEP